MGSNIVYRGLAAGEKPALGCLPARRELLMCLCSATWLARSIARGSPRRRALDIATTDIATTKYGKFGVVGIDLKKVTSEVVDISGFPDTPRMCSNWA